MGLIFPGGTTVSIIDYGTSGAGTAISHIKGVGENTVETKMGNVQGLADTEVIEVPSNVSDPGEVEFTVFLDDTTSASNFLTTLRTKRAAKTKQTVTIDLPGSADPLVGPYSGYIKDITSPAVEVGDEALTYKFKLRVSAG